MLVFPCDLTWTHAEAWLLNTERPESQKKPLRVLFYQSMVVFFLHLFCLCFRFFLNHVSRPFLADWPFSITSISASALSTFYSHPFSEQLQTNSPFLLPHHCCILIQTTMNFSTHMVPHLWFILCVTCCSSHCFSGFQAKGHLIVPSLSPRGGGC